MSEWSSVKLCDVVNLLLGMILFFRPGYSALARPLAYDVAEHRIVVHDFDGSARCLRGLGGMAQFGRRS